LEPSQVSRCFCTPRHTGQTLLRVLIATDPVPPGAVLGRDFGPALPVSRELCAAADDSAARPSPVHTEPDNLRAVERANRRAIVRAESAICVNCRVSCRRSVLSVSMPGTGGRDERCPLVSGGERWRGCAFLRAGECLREDLRPPADGSAVPPVGRPAARAQPSSLGTSGEAPRILTALHRVLPVIYY